MVTASRNANLRCMMRSGKRPEVRLDAAPERGPERPDDGGGDSGRDECRADRKREIPLRHAGLFGSGHVNGQTEAFDDKAQSHPIKVRLVRSTPRACVQYSRAPEIAA